MYAVVIIGGFQHKVAVGDEIAVQKFEGDQGNKATFEEVLMLGDGKKSVIGTPIVAKAKVEATILRQGKDDKVIIFKKKRRKGYKVKKGHRQELTWIRIDKITSGPATKDKPKVAAKKSESSE